MSDTTHGEEWRELVSAYADGECEPSERDRIEAHLEICGECRQWMEQVRADQKVFTDGLRSSAEGVDVADRVMQEVEPMPKPEPAAPASGGRLVPRLGGVGTIAMRLRLVEVFAIVVIMCLLAAALFPVFSRSREKARQASAMSNLRQLDLAATLYATERARVASCDSNLRQIGSAMLMFAGDHDGRLPDAHRWAEQLEPYIRDEQIYKCAHDKSKAKVSYAMNPRYSGANMNDYENPAELIIFFDADESGRPVARHNGGVNCAFMDGHAKWLRGIPGQLSRTTGVAPPTRNYGLADKLKLAYAASAELWVKSVHQATIAAESTLNQHGGFVLSSTLQAVRKPYDAQIVGRVPTEKVADTINALGELGWVAQREIRGEDLTRDYLDQRRELRTTERRQERLERVVEQATQRKHVVATEENLAQTETAHDAADSELYHIADRTTLATITATITQQEIETVPPAPLRGSWHSAVGALKHVGTRAAQAGIWLGIFAWLWLPALWLGLRAVRRRRSSVRGLPEANGE